jgi:quinolinate synthase
MKVNTLEKLYLCLKNEKPEILLSEETLQLAQNPLNQMFKLTYA